MLASAEHMHPIESAGQIHLGGVISPFNAWLINRGLATLPMRMQAHEQNALAVARFLESHPRVLKVLYPGLESHPHHALAKKQMQNFSGMLSFQVEGGAGLAPKFMEKLQVIHYAVSLGHHRSLICWLGTDDLMKSTYNLAGEQLDAYREFAGEGVYRLSVGLEDPEALKQVFATAIAEATVTP